MRESARETVREGGGKRERGGFRRKWTHTSERASEREREGARARGRDRGGQRGFQTRWTHTQMIQRRRACATTCCRILPAVSLRGSPVRSVRGASQPQIEPHKLNNSWCVYLHSRHVYAGGARLPTRWSTTLSSSVDLRHTINLRPYVVQI